MSGQTLTPLLRKINEINGFLQDKNIKKARTEFAPLQTKYLSEDASQLVKSVQISILREEQNEFEAIKLAKMLLSEKPTQVQVLTSITRCFHSFGYEEEYLEALKLQYKLTHDLTILMMIIHQLMVLENFTEAQVLAIELKLTNPLFMGVATFFRAEFTKNIPYYKLAVKQLQKNGEKHHDVQEIICISLIKSEQFQECYEYIQSQKDLDHFFLRYEIKALIGLGNKPKAVEIALKFIKEVHLDSIDEWRIVAKYHPDPISIIEQFTTENSRGPDLVRIEIQPDYLVTYIKKFENHSFLFSDVFPYLKEPLDVVDQAVRLYTTGEFIGDISSGRSAVIFAQYQMNRFLDSGDRSNLFEAIKKLREFNDSQECNVMLIRLFGILGMTGAAFQYKKKVKVDAIQFLSLGSMYIKDEFECCDIVNLISTLFEVRNFCSKSLPQFAQFLEVAVNNYAFIPIMDTCKMYQQIRNHIVRRFEKLFSLWKGIVDPKTEILDEQLSIADESSSNLETIRDITVIPEYVQNKEVFNLIYPELSQLVNLLCGVINVLSKKSTKHLDNKDLCEGWKFFKLFAQNEIPIPETLDLNPFQIVSIGALTKNREKHQVLIQKLDQWYEKRELELLSFPFKELCDGEIALLKENKSHLKSYLMNSQ